MGGVSLCGLRWLPHILRADANSKKRWRPYGFLPVLLPLSSEEDPQKTLHTVPYVALMRTGAQALSPPIWGKGDEMPATWSLPDSSSGLGTAQVKGAQLEAAPVSYAALPSLLNPPAILPGQLPSSP